MPREYLPKHLLAIALDDVPMTGDDTIEIPGVDLPDTGAVAGAVLVAVAEDVPLDALVGFCGPLRAEEEIP